MWGMGRRMARMCSRREVISIMRKRKGGEGRGRVMKEG